MIRTQAKGRRYILETDKLGSLHAGAPIYFREIHVGEVLGYELGKSGKRVLIHVFVDAPYHQLVRQHTRFWNVSGVDLSIGAEGVNVRTGSLQSLLAGGVAFDTPRGDTSNKLLNDAALHKAVKNANTTLKAIHALIQDLDKEIVPITTQLQETLTGLNESSPAYVNLVGSLQELKAAARSVRSLTNYLERNPNALIAGKNRPGS